MMHFFCPKKKACHQQLKYIPARKDKSFENQTRSPFVVKNGQEQERQVLLSKSNLKDGAERKF